MIVNGKKEENIVCMLLFFITLKLWPKYPPSSYGMLFELPNACNRSSL